MARPNETAVYGMVTAAYFFLFMYRYNRGRVSTDMRAMANVVVLFMLAQPLCRIIGGTNGVVTFAALCMTSIIMLPSPEDERRERPSEKRAKKERDTKNKRSKSHKKLDSKRSSKQE